MNTELPAMRKQIDSEQELPHLTLVLRSNTAVRNRWPVAYYLAALQITNQILK